MKARVNRTGKIVTIMENIGYPGGYVASDGRTYRDEDLELIVDEEPDYWTRLEHQAAISAMQGICSSDIIMEKINRINAEADKFGVLIAELSANLAHALVEKYKKEERK